MVWCEKHTGECLKMLYILYLSNELYWILEIELDLFSNPNKKLSLELGGQELKTRKNQTIELFIIFRPSWAHIFSRISRILANKIFLWDKWISSILANKIFQILKTNLIITNQIVRFMTFVKISLRIF